jgi:threonine synthase
LLAETEGIFTETAGGVTTAVTRKLVEQGKIRPDETTVACITGNGLKTLDALSGQVFEEIVIEPKVAAFEACLEEAAVELV